MKSSADLDGDETHFAWWVIELSASHVPKIDDPGIRDEVILTAKRQKARELARKRAEDLASIIRDALAKPEGERKDMAASIEGQTVTGKPDAPGLAMRQTQIFSWLEPPMNPQMELFSQSPPRISEIRFSDDTGSTIRYAYDRFMKRVFEELAAGEVGVLSDDLVRSFYVVMPVDRNTSDDILRQQFMTEGRQFQFQFGSLANLAGTVAGRPAISAWQSALWKKYGIDRDVLPEE